MESNEQSVFLIFCQDKEDVARIKSDITRMLACQIETADTTEAVHKRILSGELDCLIVNCKFFNNASMTTIEDLRRTVPELPVIVVAENIDKEIYAFTRRLKDMVLVQRPFKINVMGELALKVSQGRGLYIRQHERFPVFQRVAAEVVAESKNAESRKVEAVLRNMSRGGAYLECDTILKMGEILRMTVQLDKVSKDHVLYGEVVRVNLEAFGFGKHGIGVRYISSQELYNHLLHKS